MNKELNYLGYAAAPADYECQDGELAVAMDIWPEGGALKPALQPEEVLQFSSSYEKILYVHESGSFAGHSHLIGFNSNTGRIFWIDKQDAQKTIHYPVNNITITNSVKINGVGNTVIVYTGNSLYHFLWKNNNYTYLGTEIPRLRLSFGLQGEMRKSELFVLNFAETIPEDEIWDDLSDENKTRATSEVLAKVNKFIADESTNAGRFIFPFLVRYAYRLYDGTLIRHSAPVLMECASSITPQAIIHELIHSDTGIYGQARYSVCAMRHKLDYAVASAQELAALQDWSDIVKSVDIFISAPIYAYDQSGECKRFTENPEDTNGGYSVCKQTNFVQPAFDVLRYESRDFRSRHMATFQYDPTDPSYSYRANRIQLPIKSKATVEQSIKDCSQFFFLQKIAVDELATQRTIIEVKEDYLQSLVNREVMDDDYDSHDRLIPNYLFPYNQRINYADLYKSLFRGFTALEAFCYSDGVSHMEVSPSADDFVYDVDIYVHTKQDGREIVLKADNGQVTCRMANKCFPLYFYYPNTNADRAYLLFYKTVSGQRVLDHKYMLKLEPHNFLNGAYYFAGWSEPTVYTGSVPTVSQDSERIIPIQNKVYTSDVNNPFKFAVTNINTIGTGRIMAISTAAKALSQGQFGAFPLYAFTTDGVWALEVSSTTGAFSAKQPITRDVCLGADSVTQIDDAVLFATDRGVMIIAGSQTDCISEVIDGKSDDAFSLNQLPQAADILIGQSPAGTPFNFVPFREFLPGSRMMYDYVSQRIIVFNPSYSYAYIYSKQMKRWAMMRSAIKSAVNSYPECLAMTSDNRLVDFSVRVPNLTPANQVVITRPLKLDAPDILKTIRTIIQRGNFDEHNGDSRRPVQVLLYGSRDLINWFPVFSSNDKYLRGFSGTPYKYFRIALKCALADNESISGCSIQYEIKEANRLR